MLHCIFSTSCNILQIRDIFFGEISVEDSIVTNREAQSNERLATHCVTTLSKVEVRKFNFLIPRGDAYSAVSVEVHEACKTDELLRSSRPSNRFSTEFPLAVKKVRQKVSRTRQMFHACHATHSNLLRGSHKYLRNTIRINRWRRIHEETNC